MQFSSDQAASRIVLENGTVISKCDQCRQMYSERKPPGEPPCHTCWIDLKEENEDVARIFQIVRGQVITRFNGQVDMIMDLNHLAVWAAIDRYGIKNPRECFEKVMKMFYALLKEQRDREK
jgi:hypothetical protein